MNRLRQTLRWLLPLLILLAPFSQARTLKACGHPFYPPVSWISAGTLTGLAPTLAQNLFAELGYQVQLSAESNWKRCLLEVENGEADIVVAAYRIASRDAYLSYSDQYLIADTVTLFVNRTSPIRFDGLEDLRGKTAGLLLGDSFGDRFDHFIQQNSHIEYVSKGQQNFQKLALGRIDYMPLGQRSGRLQSQKLGFHDQIVPLPDAITTEHYYLAVGRNSDLQQHLPFINRRLREMHRDGTIRRLAEQFGQLFLDTP